MTHPLGSLGGEAELASSLAWGDCVPGAGVRLWPGLLALVGNLCTGTVHSVMCWWNWVSSLQTNYAAPQLCTLAPGASVGMLSESDYQRMRNDS